MIRPLGCSRIMESISCSRDPVFSRIVLLLALLLISDKFQLCHGAVDEEEFSGDVWHEFFDNAIKRSMSQTSTANNYKKAINSIRDTQLLSHCITFLYNPVEDNQTSLTYDLNSMCGIQSVWLIPDTVLMTFSFSRQWYIHSWKSMVNLTINEFKVPDNVHCNHNYLTIQGVMGVKSRLCGRHFKQSYFAINGVNISLQVISLLGEVKVSFLHQIGIFQTILSEYHTSDFRESSESAQVAALPPSLARNSISFLTRYKRIYYQFSSYSMLTSLSFYLFLLPNISVYLHDGPGSLSPLLKSYIHRGDLNPIWHYAKFQLFADIYIDRDFSLPVNHTIIYFFPTGAYSFRKNLNPIELKESGNYSCGNKMMNINKDPVKIKISSNNKFNTWCFLALPDEVFRKAHPITMTVNYFKFTSPSVIYETNHDIHECSFGGLYVASFSKLLQFCDNVKSLNLTTFHLPLDVIAVVILFWRGYSEGALELDIITNVKPSHNKLVSEGMTLCKQDICEDNNKIWTESIPIEPPIQAYHFQYVLNPYDMHKNKPSRIRVTSSESKEFTIGSITIAMEFTTLQQHFKGKPRDCGNLLEFRVWTGNDRIKPRINITKFISHPHREHFELDSVIGLEVVITLCPEVLARNVLNYKLSLEIVTVCGVLSTPIKFPAQIGADCQNITFSHLLPHVAFTSLRPLNVSLQLGDTCHEVRDCFLLDIRASHSSSVCGIEWKNVSLRYKPFSADPFISFNITINTMPICTSLRLKYIECEFVLLLLPFKVAVTGIHNYGTKMSTVNDSIVGIEDSREEIISQKR